MRLLKQSSTGFTIIEVMIVLVIAAVILLIVFLAVPALQRNSRNTQRNNEIARLSAAMFEYLNNGGTIPGTTIGSNQALANQLAEEVDIRQFNKVEITSSNLTIDDQPTSKQVAQFRLNRICNDTGTNIQTGSAGNKSGRIALVFWLESSSGGYNAGRCLEVR